MARPAVGVLTARLYDRLPELYRAADEPLDWPLLRYLSTLLDQASDLEVIYDRIDFVPVDEGGDPDDVSELVDPALADAAWLPWLAQLVGVRAERAPESFLAPYGELSTLHATYAALDAAYGTYGDQAEATTEGSGGSLSIAELRQAIATASTGWRAGSAGSIADVVEPVLTGTQRVDVIANADGDPWLVRIRTYEAETPEPWRVEVAIARSGLKPAGVVFDIVTASGASYGDLSSEFATYTLFAAELATYAEARAHVPA